RSRPPPSSGSRAAALAAALLWAAGLAAGLSAAAGAAAADPLHETRGGAEIDWGEGTLTAQGGAAADLRMPSAEVARPGSLRRARAAALGKLRAALVELPLGGGRSLTPDAIDRALGRARTVGVDYQSNGGAVARV